MKAINDPVVLRIYLEEADQYGGRPLYEALVFAAREAGLAGATVLRGPMGYGHDHRLHTSKILELSTDLPMVVEIVDARAAIERFAARLRAMAPGILATVCPVQVVDTTAGPAE